VNSLLLKFSEALVAFTAYESVYKSRRYTVDNRKPWITKIVWLLLVLFGIGLALYQIENRIAYYVQRPTAAKVDIENNAMLKFPQVTICNENLMTLSAAERLG
jgi:ABC-type nickel/cobalt efflux system permease component RcnA